MSDGFSIDLSGAEESSFGGDFAPLPNGTYDAVAYDAEIKHTIGRPGAKLPAGTPMVNTQFKITEGGEEGEWYNRRVFRSFIIAPDKIEDPETGKKVKNPNKGKSDGILLSFLKALGNDDSEIRSSDFSLNFDEHIRGRACRVKLKQRSYTNDATGKTTVQNDVVVVLPADEGAETEDAGAELLA
jgi:hypothetical protein